MVDFMVKTEGRLTVVQGQQSVAFTAQRRTIDGRNKQIDFRFTAPSERGSARPLSALSGGKSSGGLRGSTHHANRLPDGGVFDGYEIQPEVICPDVQSRLVDELIVVRLLTSRVNRRLEYRPV